MPKLTLEAARKVRPEPDGVCSDRCPHWSPQKNRHGGPHHRLVGKCVVDECRCGVELTFDPVLCELDWVPTPCRHDNRARRLRLLALERDARRAAKDARRAEAAIRRNAGVLGGYVD